MSFEKRKEGLVFALIARIPEVKMERQQDVAVVPI